MYINEDTSDALYQITAYDTHSVTIGKTIIKQPVIVFAQELVTDWSVPSLAAVTEHSLSIIIARRPDILLIGTGSQPQHLAANLRSYLEEHGIGVECMTTPAACRSYMALLSEGRNVAAMLFLGP